MDMYTAILVITTVFLAVTISDVCTNRVINKTMEQGVVLICLLLEVSIFCEWVGVKTNGADASLIIVHKTVKCIEFCVSPFIGLVAAITYGKAKRPLIITTILIIHALFEIIAINTNMVFYVDEANIYHRSRLYWIYIGVFSVSIIYCFINMVLEEIKEYSRPDAVLITTLVFLTVGVGMQMMESELRVEFMCVAVGNFSLYNHRCKMIFQLDGLTNLLSRRRYEKDIERIDSPAYIINMDINKFKAINDTYGHTVGDYYLKSVSKAIRKTYGRYGYCYRCGGDEFCIVLMKTKKGVEFLNREFLKEIENLKCSDEKHPDVSIGYAYYDKKEDVETVIKKADEMMYENKIKQ